MTSPTYFLRMFMLPARQCAKQKSQHTIPIQGIQTRIKLDKIKLIPTLLSWKLLSSSLLIYFKVETAGWLLHSSCTSNTPVRMHLLSNLFLMWLNVWVLVNIGNKNGKQKWAELKHVQGGEEGNGGCVNQI